MNNNLVLYRNGIGFDEALDEIELQTKLYIPNTSIILFKTETTAYVICRKKDANNPIADLKVPFVTDTTNILQYEINNDNYLVVVESDGHIHSLKDMVIDEIFEYFKKDYANYNSYKEIDIISSNNELPNVNNESLKEELKNATSVIKTALIL